MTTWTVKPSGGDYTTLASALSNASTVASDIIEISGDWTSTTDTSAATVADDTITIQTKAGDQARHVGFDNGGSNYELAVSAAHALTVNNTGCVIDGLIIKQDGTGASDEGIRYGATTDNSTFTVKNTIIWADTADTDQDGWYKSTGSGEDTTSNFEQVYVFGFDRCGIYGESNSAGSHTFNINSCGFWNNGQGAAGGDTEHGGINIRNRIVSTTVTANVHNTWSLGNTTSTANDYNEEADDGTLTWNISHCIDSDNSIATVRDTGTNNLASRTLRDVTVSGAEVLVQDITTAPYDLRLLPDAANNDAQGVHTTASVHGLTIPSTDITGGNTRVGTFCIGPIKVVQLNNFTGFETQGLEEFLSSSGTPTWVAGRSGGAAIRFNGSANIDVGWFHNFTSGVNGGDGHVLGFALKADDKDPSNASAQIVSFSDSTGIFLALAILQTSSNIEIRDATGSVIRTITDPLTTSFKYFELYFEHSATGTVELFIDGVSQGEDINQDLTDGGTLTGSFRLTAGTGLDFMYDDVYLISGATVASDRFGDFAVKTYQNTAEDATDQGDALADGTWALVSETPGNEGTSNDAGYVDTGNLTGSTITDEGTRKGPNTDTDVTGAIKGAKYISNLKRTTGADRAQTILYGNSGDGVVATADLDLAVSYVIHEVLSQSGLIVPLASESFQMGFSKSATAGQDVFCGDQWCMLGYVPAGVTDTPMVAAAGAYTLTGVAANTLWGHVLPTVKGSYALTGVAALTAKDTPMTAVQGAYALTGIAALFPRTHVMVGAQGAYTYTGVAAGTLWDHLIAAVAGGYNLTGVAAITSRAVTIVADQGTYTLTGIAADTFWGHLIGAVSGAYALTGVAADTRKGSTMVAAQGAYNLTGVAANTLWAHVISAAQGAYVLTGNAAVTAEGFRLVAVTGAYVLTGVAADFLRTHVVVADQGTYALTGNDAVLTRTYIAVADQGSYTLTGNASNLLWKHIITAVAGAYALTGNPAVTIFTPVGATTMVADQGAYTYTGFAAVTLFSGLAAGTYLIPIGRRRRRS